MTRRPGPFLFYLNCFEVTLTAEVPKLWVSVALSTKHVDLGEPITGGFLSQTIRKGRGRFNFVFLGHELLILLYLTGSSYLVSGFQMNATVLRLLLLLKSPLTI